MGFPIDVELGHAVRRGCFQTNVNLIVSQDSSAIHVRRAKHEIQPLAVTHGYGLLTGTGLVPIQGRRLKTVRRQPFGDTSEVDLQITRLYTKQVKSRLARCIRPNDI